MKTVVFSKDFILVATGQIISIFGNQILRYALPLYLLNQTGSPALFGTILAISFVPMLIMFRIGGIIADRVNKRNIMVILDFGTAAVILGFYLLSGRVDIVPLMAVTMIMLFGIQGAYQPAVKASIPALVQRRHMMKANSVVDMINSVASMAGPVAGGLLFSVFGLLPILYVSMGCFLAAAVMEIFIHIPFERRESKANIIATGMYDLKESFRFMFGDEPVLWKISLIFSSSNLLLTSLVLIALPVIITQSLGFAPDAAYRLYGYSQGVVAAGAIAGGLLAGVLSGRLKPKSSPLLLIGSSLCVAMAGVALQTMSGSPAVTYVVLILCCGLLLTLHTLFQIQMLTVLQVLTPQELTGKVIACFMCVVMCTTPLGQFVYGMAFDRVGSLTYIPFYAAASVMMVIVIFTRRVFYGIGDSGERE